MRELKQHEIATVSGGSTSGYPVVTRLFPDPTQAQAIWGQAIGKSAFQIPNLNLVEDHIFKNNPGS